MAENWDEHDYELLREPMLRGIYETTYGVKGRTVFVPVVFKHIEMKGYWGNPQALEKYFKFRDDNDIYKSNVRKVTRWLADQQYLKEHNSPDQVSMEQKCVDFITDRFGQPYPD